MAVQELGAPDLSGVDADNFADAGGPLAALTGQDRGFLRDLSALLLDAVPSFSSDCAAFLYERVGGLPDEPQFVQALEAHVSADAAELLVALRAGISPTAHETPTEALEYARLIRHRGVPFPTLVSLYKQGFAMFRDVVGLELEARLSDAAQVRRVSAAIDTYAFPFIATALRRLAYEFGAEEAGWTPTAGDPVLAEEAPAERARRLRESATAAGRWTATSPERSSARSLAEHKLNEFATRLEDGITARGLSDRLALAATSVTITLADEPDLSLTLLLDRTPVEIVDGEAGAVSRLWVASVDVPRIFSSEYYLPMAIVKGRVRVSGPVRRFLRVIPILRAIGDGQEPAPAAPLD